jgi:hypothetical protein
VVAPFAFTKGDATFFGISESVLGPITLLVAIIDAAIYSGRNWRCHACDMYLGRAFNPKHCRRCGIELRA